MIQGSFLCLKGFAGFDKILWDTFSGHFWDTFKGTRQMARKTDYGIWEDERKPQAKKRADGKWECTAKASAQYPMANGGVKRFKRIADTKQEAEVAAWTARNKWEREQRLGLESGIDKSKTLKVYMQEHLKDRLKRPIRYGGKSYAVLTGSTYKNYSQALDAAFYKTQFAGLQLSMITMPRVVNYLNLVARQHNRSTLRNVSVCLNSLFAELYYKGLIPENYMLNAKPDVLPEVKKQDIAKETLTDDDIRIIYNAFKEDHGRHRYYAAYVLMIETGIRQQELFAIRLDNIDKENGVLLITSAISERYRQEWIETGKGKKIEVYEKELKGKERKRLIKLSSYALEAVEQLEKQLEQYCRSNPKGLLLPIYKNGEYLYESAFEAIWKMDCRRLGIERPKGFGPHKMRHTGITIMETRTDGNTTAISQMVGHKSESVHRLYTHQEIEAVRQIQTPMETIQTEKQGEMSEEDKELYEMYKRLKTKFGDL